MAVSIIETKCPMPAVPAWVFDPHDYRLRSPQETATFGQLTTGREALDLVEYLPKIMRSRR
jgi:hypothetical protein